VHPDRDHRQPSRVLLLALGRHAIRVLLGSFGVQCGAAGYALLHAATSLLGLSKLQHRRSVRYFPLTAPPPSLSGPPVNPLWRPSTSRGSSGVRGTREVWRYGTLAVMEETGTSDAGGADGPSNRTGKVMCSITISVDGFVAGPRQSRETPLGERGELLHRWMF